MATDLVQSYLVLRDAKHSKRKLRIAELFIEKMQTRVHMHMHCILDGGSTFLRNYREVLG
jgi:3-(methylthio)propanoyl-CoA dehydrogenase